MYALKEGLRGFKVITRVYYFEVPLKAFKYYKHNSINDFFANTKKTVGQIFP